MTDSVPEIRFRAFLLPIFEAENHSFLFCITSQCYSKNHDENEALIFPFHFVSRQGIELNKAATPHTSFVNVYTISL